MNKEKLFIVIDIETTGFRFDDGVTEITAKYFTESNPRLENLFNELTNPGRLIPQNIQELTGITNQMVDKANMRDFEAFAKLSVDIEKLMLRHDVYVVAHNAEFEKNFLAWNLTQRVFRKIKFIDTRANHLLIKDEDVLKNKWTKNYSKLEQAAEHFDFTYDLEKAHRAEYDVDLTAKVLKEQMKTLSVEGMVSAMKKFIGVE